MNPRRSWLAAGSAWPALAWTGALHAQANPPAIIGWLQVNRRERNGWGPKAFHEGTAALGWKMGAQYVLEERGMVFSNGMFPSPPGRARLLRADLLGSFGRVLACPVAHGAAAASPPDLKTARASGKPSRSTGPHRARPAAGAAPPRSPWDRAAITPPT